MNQVTSYFSRADMAQPVLNFSLPSDQITNWESGNSINVTNAISPGIVMDSALETIAVDRVSNEERFNTTVPPESRTDPSQPRRIGRAEWEKHEDVIRELYPVQTLHDIRRRMVAEHGFTASMQQWKKKISEWQLKKNLRPRVTRFIRKQRRRHGTRKFRFRGRPISSDLVDRHSKQPPSNPSLSIGRTPTDLSYGTSVPPMRLGPPSNLSQTQQLEIYQRPTTPVPDLEGTSVPDLLVPALWQDHNIDYYLTLAQRAISDEKGGDYIKAKPAFLKSLEGLGVLLRPYHVKSISLLETFMEAARRNNDSSTEISELSKSYRAHTNLLGNGDKRTWRSLARLGDAYFHAGNTNEAYHMLLNARQGLLTTMLKSKREDIFDSTVHISRTIAKLFLRQGDYDEAEKEYVDLFLQAESLGENYLWRLNESKWELGNVYLTQYRRGQRTISYQQIQNYLLEFMQSHDTKQDEQYIPSLSFLAGYDNAIGRHEKLQELLPLAEEVSADPGFGSRSTVALALYFDQSWLYLRQEKHGCVVDTLREAGLVAREMLPPDHDFFTLLASILNRDKVLVAPCMVCLKSEEHHQDGMPCKIQEGQST
ncbi:hypothetical protein F4806DRAFT_467253 [Annulohypoxylon nitens]|nr:hypothetical protein F4806DRAFT_467253 [Annulohypoxylon nitens]